MPFLGDSAIRHMAAVLEGFEHELYPALASRQSDMPVAPDGARQSTMNINSVHGGQDEGHQGLPSPCVADSCRVVIDRRYLIEETPEQVKGEVRALLDRLAQERRGFRYELRDLFEVAPVMTDRDNPVPRAVARAISEVMGREAQFICSPGTYDQKHIDRIGKLKDCIAYGPGVLDLAHQPDEWVGIGDMAAAAKVMARAAVRLLRKEI
jgi:succinyl-diaminopimelate desuccinylase